MLTPKRERFVQHYVITGSASEAARLAGYAANSAKQEGSRLLTFADVRLAVETEQARLRERFELKAQDVLEGLKRIAEDPLAPAAARVQAWRNLGLHLGLFEYNAVAEGTAAFLSFLAGDSGKPAVEAEGRVLDS